MARRLRRRHVRAPWGADPHPFVPEDRPMFVNLRRAEIPLGMLAEEITIWQAVGGKVHLASDCQNGYQPRRTRSLIDIIPGSLCAKCERKLTSHLPDPQKMYLEQANKLLSWRDDAATCTEWAASDATGGPSPLERWLIVAAQLHLVDLRAACDYSELNTWALSHLRPVLVGALTALTNRDQMSGLVGVSPRQAAARLYATCGLGGLGVGHFQVEVPKTPTLGHLVNHSHDGRSHRKTLASYAANKVAIVARDTLVAQWAHSGDLDASLRAARAAALPRLEKVKAYDPETIVHSSLAELADLLPAGATLGDAIQHTTTAAATVELDEVLSAFAADIAGRRDSLTQAPKEGTWVHSVPVADLRVDTLQGAAAALVLTHDVRHLGRHRDRRVAFLVLPPDWADAVNRNAVRGITLTAWGPVEATDDAEIFDTATMLLAADAGVRTEQEALPLARATCLVPDSHAS